MMYLIGHSRSCRPHGIRTCGTLSHCARLLRSSCRAPKGQSQPQNGPRPQNNKAAATPDQRMKIRGAARKNVQLKPVTSELMNVSTLTTDSWAFAYHPSQTRVKTR